MLSNGQRDRQKYPARSAEDFLGASDRGSAEWWRAVEEAGAPLVDRLGDGTVCVTFLWREAGHAGQRVYIDVNGVTDHHSATPQTLEWLPDTDIWFWQADLPSSWRGSYAFIPATTGGPSVYAEDTPEQRRLRQRAWWSGIMAGAKPDPLNPLRAHPSGWGALASALHLPDAPDQAAWSRIDSQEAMVPPIAPVAFTWRSALQGKARTVWSHLTADPSQPSPADGYPLVVLLDGQNWAGRMPVAPVLTAQTAAGHLPAAHYLMIDSIDGSHREEDLPPNPAFWSAIWHELVPLAQDIAPVCTDSRRRIVAGQSYGGLAALYAALERPNRWGGVVAQSASLWWPDPSLLQAGGRCPGAEGWLAERLRGDALPEGRVRIFLEVGSREDVMIDFSDSTHAALIAAGHTAVYRHFEGGHDALCWRGGLIDGLTWLLKPTNDCPDAIEESDT